MRRLNPTAIALLAGAFVLLIILFVVGTTRGGNTDKLRDDQVVASQATDPEKTCASQHTYDLIKRELFRRAAEVRGSDQGAFDSLSTYSVVRMDAPMLKSHDENLGIIRCTGSLALDLPPGVSVVGGRRTLEADIEYAIQPAADGSGDVLTLSNADAIITPLATLARVGTATGQPLAPMAPADQAEAPAAEPGPAQPAPPPVRTPPPSPVRTPFPPAPEPTAETAQPSFNCRAARTRGEIAVCGDLGLASLDRQMAGQFNRAMSEADPDQQALLRRTRSRFLSYRDGCRSDDCIANAYRGRMTEIRDIMSGRWNAPR